MVDETTCDSGTSELAQRNPENMTDRAILVAVFEEMRDIAQRQVAQDARLDGLDARLSNIEREVHELAKRGQDVDGVLRKLLELNTTLAEERLQDRQRIVDLDSWRTRHERGNTHCETCPYHAEASSVGVGGVG